MNTLKNFLILVLKGAGMGAANVIPGVSGGTVALITGIFEELIDAIKSFNLEAIRLILKGKFRAFAVHVHLGFLVAVFLGIAISILSLARLLEYLFANFPVYIWAYFFGLILASVYFVGRTVNRWTIGVILVFIAGTLIAFSISFLSPATENEGFLYLIICGIIAVCSMILPGLSGSFVLILLGNYHLVMIRAVNDLRLEILIPVVLGGGIGLIAFSHLLSWIFKKFRDQTIAGLTGFILGSLVILWPWKRSYDSEGLEIATNKLGAFIDNDGAILTEIKVYAYDLIAPASPDKVLWIAVLWMALGIISIILMERLAGINKHSKS